LLWLRLFRSRVVLRRAGRAGVSGIAWPGSGTRAARLCLHANTALSRNVYHTAVHSFKFMMSNSNGENVNDRCRVCAFVFVNKTRKRIIDGDFLKKLKKSIIKTSGKTMAFPVQCVTLATTELKQCGYRLQLSIRATIFRRGDIPFPL